MKVIFLDIDGVLNGYNVFTDKSYRLMRVLHLLKYWRKHYDLFGIRTHKVKLLKRIIDNTGAKVVISSSWRFGWECPYGQKVGNQKILHDKFNKYDIEVIGITPRLKTREEEIRAWLSKHPNVKQFVVLDDEQSDLKGFIGKELVRTSARDKIRGYGYEDTGLKRKHVKQAINILNKER